MGKIGTIGKPYKLKLPQRYVLSANVILIQPKNSIIHSDFLFWQFSSPFIVNQLTEGATATSQPAFGIKKARLLDVRICSMELQNIIVQEIDSRMSVCDSIEQTVDTSLQQAEALRQSILKQAFEGEL
jgi:type I restriction enzyme S subunit